MAKISFIFLLLLVAASFFEAAAGNSCSWGNFYCSRSRQCISSQWRCDGDNDCIYREDEQDCVTVCSNQKSGFRCNNYRCITRSHVCDGDNDCGDNSDESNYLCGVHTTVTTNICTWEYFMCANSSKCIQSVKRCDGTSDCTYGEDESNCPPRCTGLNYRYFRCSNNTNCINRMGLCNGYDNCHNGYDESTALCGGTAFPVRLAGGRWPSEGRVEVYYSPDRTWGTVCDNRWDELDANVVCRQLGLPPATQVVSDAGFGHGTGPILLDGLRCTGSESSLSECPSRGWKNHDYCYHRDDAGVVCGNQVPAGTSPIRCRYCRSSTSDDQCHNVTCSQNEIFCYRKTADQFRRGSTVRVTEAGCTTSCTSDETINLCRFEMNCKLSCCRTSLCNSGKTIPLPLQCHSCNSTCSCTTTTCPSDSRYCYRKTYDRTIGGSKIRATKAGCTSSCTFPDRTAACRYESNCEMTCCTTPLCNSVYSVGRSTPSCYTCSSTSSYKDCENKAKLTKCNSSFAYCYKMDYVSSRSLSNAEASVYKKGCTIDSSSCSQVESTYCSTGLKHNCRVYCCKDSGCNAGSIQRFSVVVLVTCAVAFLVLGYPAVKPSYSWILG